MFNGLQAASIGATGNFGLHHKAIFNSLVNSGDQDSLIWLQLRA